MSDKRKPVDLLHGSVEKRLISMAIPMTFGILSIILFNVVDTIYVGHLGTSELAAMSFTFPIVFIVISITMGIGIGTASVISRAIGSGDTARVKRLTTDSLSLAVLIVVCTAGVGLLTINPVFRLLGATDDLLPLIHDYMTLWFLGVGLLVIPMVGNSCIRATGDTKTPSIIMVIAGLGNAVLDPFFIFGIGPFPRLELTGAAVATVCSWFFAFSAALWVLIKREKLIVFPLFAGAQSLSSWKDILYIGLPAAATNLLVPLSTAVLTRMVSWYGPAAVAAFGVGGRLESLSMIGIMALSTALAPFVGQNYGAGKCDRIRKALNFSITFSLAWGALNTVIFYFFARHMAVLFNDEPAVVSAVILYCHIIPLSFGLYGVAVLINSTYNALNKPLHSTFIILLRLFVFTIPLAYAGAYFWELKGIFWAMTVGNVLIGLVSFAMVRSILRHVDEQALEEVNGTRECIPG